MNEAVRDIVCDTGSLIHLDELGCLDLLADFKNVVLSGSVVEEIENQRPIALTAKLPFKVLPAQDFSEERLATMCRIFSIKGDNHPNQEGVQPLMKATVSMNLRILSAYSPHSSGRLHRAGDGRRAQDLEIAHSCRRATMGSRQAALSAGK